jgi:hypothetical protein
VWDFLNCIDDNMPTSTLSQYSLVNFGPLTTTYTAPASCATVASNVAFGFKDAPSIIPFSADCTFTSYGSCLPSGSGLDSQILSSQTEVQLFRYIDYFSPGISCPNGWATVGVAAKATDGSVSSTGAFSVELGFSTAKPTGVLNVLVNPPINVLMAAMDPGETAVLCCPRFVAFTYCLKNVNLFY